MIVTKKRSFIKALSWRVIGSIDTFVLSLIIINFSSENYTYDLAFYIATLEVITKTIIYYLHERLWNKVISKGIYMENNCFFRYFCD